MYLTCVKDIGSVTEDVKSFFSESEKDMPEGLSVDAREFVRLMNATMEVMGWSATDLAEFIGCSDSSLTEIAKGKLNPSRLIQKFRLRLAVKKPEILKRAYSERQLEAMELRETIDATPSWAKHLLDDLASLPDPEREEAIDAIRKLIGLAPARSCGQDARKKNA